MKSFKHIGDFVFQDIPTQNINGKRYYKIDEDKKYPSITTVVGTLPDKVKGLANWRKRVGDKEANRISVQSARKGTAVHDMIEQYLDNSLNLESMNPIAVESFRKIQPLLDKYVDKIYMQEVPLWSQHLGVAGRVDCVGHFNDKLSIIDFKTARKPKKKEWISDYFMQACGYSIMWEERTNIPISQLVIMISPTEGSPQVYIEDRDTWAQPLLDQIEYFYGER
tara:strand:- start:490 stop:1158 length:669 start_codon:yes stop_codon:yes gene_type:complete